MNVKKLALMATAVFSLSFVTGMTYSYQASHALENAPMQQERAIDATYALMAATAHLHTTT